MKKEINMDFIAFDPSGNFSNGKGTSGWCAFINNQITIGTIAASDSLTIEQHFSRHSDLTTSHKFDTIVCESYRLQGNKAMQQTGSSLETPQLIGYLRMCAYNNSTKFVLQEPSQKVRFTDDMLVDMKVLTKKGRSYFFEGKITTMHERDAIRHALIYKKKAERL